MKFYNVIALMSGTSLDGLDIAYIKFAVSENRYKFNIKKAETNKYNKNILNLLKSAENCSGYDLITKHNKYGKYLGQQINKFIKKHNIKDVDFIASHGHTIFHNPNENLTFQIGNPAYITAETGINCIADFRTSDVALGGQGAPLVPIGDELLFGDFDFCVNLGGFANISFRENNARFAFDICPVNIGLNKLANEKNIDFDKNGEFGKKGKVNKKLLDCLNNLDFYKKDFPKSLGREWFESVFCDCLNKHKIDFYDKIRTVYEHIAIQISNVLNQNNGETALFTGGGTYNSFLISLIKEKTNKKIIIPGNLIIDYKEALIFSLLGVLYMENKINILSSVTGAKKDNIGGILQKQ